MNAPGALSGYEAVMPAGMRFVNEVPARVIPSLVAYRPGRAARRVTIPILFSVSNSDTVAPPAQTVRYARTAPRGEIKRYDAGHFEFYVGDAFEAVVRDQIEFLVRQLDPTRAPSTPCPSAQPAQP